MKLLPAFILTLFLIIFIIDIGFIFSGDQAQRFFTKPFLMPLLLAYFLSRTSTRNSSMAKVFVIIALTASFAGDLILLFDTDVIFIVGVGAFLIAHLFYIAFFVRIQPFRKDSIWILPIVVIVAAIYAVYFLSLIWDAVSAKNLEFPVIVYVAVISFMFVTAVNAASGKFSKTAFLFFIPGAALFITSDSLLAYDKFLVKINDAGIEIMITYVLAQFLIISGAVKVLRKQKSRRRIRNTE